MPSVIMVVVFGIVLVVIPLCAIREIIRTRQAVFELREKIDRLLARTSDG